MSTAALTHAYFDIGGAAAPRPRVVRHTTTSAALGAISVYYDSAFENRREALAQLIQYFAATGLTWSDQEARPIEQASMETALAVIGAIPHTRALPKVTPDGEGGVMLVWDSEGSKAMITVAGTTLFPVIDPGEATSEHMQELVFAGDALPIQLLGMIPRR